MRLLGGRGDQASADGDGGDDAERAGRRGCEVLWALF
jgi:hypothetical protein